MKPSPIAIVGVACRLPGAGNVQQFWEKISTPGLDKTFPEVPPSRWALDEFYHPEIGKPGKIYQKTGGFLSGIENFNWDFFGLRQDEALRMDPQQRMALELSWQALDMATISQSELRGSETGVFVALSHVDQKRKLDDLIDGIHSENGQNTYGCFVPNRLSYHYDLIGPSIAFDSACSSGLAALNSACQSINVGEIGCALVGAFNLFLMPHEWISSSAARTLSQSPYSRPLDDRTSGYIRSEGGVMMVLMRAKDALAQGKRVLGFVKGIGLTHNGQSNGISSPSGPAIKRTFNMAVKQAGVQAGEIALYEAHATGTLLGDAIEIGAIDAVLAAAGRSQKCVLSSVKGDIGHTEAVSGLAGMLKALLCLDKESIFSLTHEVVPNRYFAARLRALELSPQARPWRARDGVRYAAVAALGFGGSNGVAILAGPELLCAPPEEIGETRPPVLRYVLVLSAAAMPMLHTAAGAYAQLLAGSGDEQAARICHAANLRSHLHGMHLVACAGTAAQLVQRLKDFQSGQASDGLLVCAHGGGAGQASLVPDFSFCRNFSPAAVAGHGDDDVCHIVSAAVNAGQAISWPLWYGGLQASPVVLPTISCGGDACWYGAWKIV
jgi:acyl transferase domain-containing protein